jgi:hypothetical protein
MNRFMAGMVAAWWAQSFWLAAAPCAVPGGGGQTRVDVRFSQVPGVVVGGGSVDYLSGYSYGLGSLDQRFSGSGGSALRSSIGQANSMSLTRGDPTLPPTGLLSDLPFNPMMIDRSRASMGVRPGLPVGTGLDLRTGDPLTGPLVAPVAPIGRPYRTEGTDAGPLGDSSDGSGLGRALAAQDDTAFGAARAYVQALAAASTSLLKDQTKPITTLVPTPTGLYRDYMAKGDRAFRTSNFQEAYSNFEIANDLGGNDPESYICLTHTQFALSKHSYAKASYLLQQALKYMPELALANLRPRGFYGSLNTYAQHLVALEEHVEKYPRDGEALLILAYFRWFGEAQDVPATQKALSEALASALAGQDTRLTEAVETFWAGMAAAGKVSGKLAPAAEPDPAARPARAGGTAAKSPAAGDGPSPKKPPAKP